MSGDTISVANVTECFVTARGGGIKAALDFPAKGVSLNIDELMLAGWILDNDQRLGQFFVEVADVRVPMAVKRFRHGGLASVGHEGEFGFSSALNLRALKYPKTVTIFGSNGAGLERTPLFSMQLEYSDIHVEPSRTPIIITAMGRSGTSYLMGLLSQHPAIASTRIFPFEDRFASYYANVFRAICRFGDSGSASDQFVRREVWDFPSNDILKASLFARLDTQARARAGSLIIAKSVSAARQLIDACYNSFCGAETDRGAPFFAEKMIGYFKTQEILVSMYPNVREIILVRDFRDCFTSAKMFNEKRKFLHFGAEHAKCNVEWIDNFAGGANDITLAAQQRKQSKIMRYEDLVEDTHQELERLFSWIGIDAAPETVSACVSAVTKEAHSEHRTTYDVKDSVGKWKRELDPDLAELSNVKLEKALKYFGYIR